MKDVLSDAALPGLSLAINPDVFLQLLQRQFRECREEVDLVEGKIQDVQYKPGISCKLLYRIKCRSRRTGRSKRQLFSVRIFSREETIPPDSQELLQKFSPLPKTPIRSPKLLLPEEKIAVYSFPFDPGLPWLMDVLDPSRLREGFRRIWSRRNVHVLKVNVEQMGYTPQARATVRCEVLSESRDTRIPELRRLVCKMHVYKRPPALFAGSWALWKALHRRVNIAAPVGFISSLNLTLQEFVRGERLPDLAHKRSFVKPVRLTSRAIALIHTLQLPLHSTRSPEKEASVLQRWRGVLTAICPEYAPRIETLCDHLAGQLLSRVEIQGPVHGDFHPANVMWDGNEVTLIDLDELSYGDPLLDVGRFLASLRVSALRISSDASALSDVGEAFLDDYFRVRPDDIRRARLFEASSLLLAAASPFRLQRKEWKEATLQILDEAEKVSKLAGTARVAISGKESITEKKVSDPEDWIRDPIYLQALLHPHVEEIYGADLTTCRVKDSNPADSLRYDLRGWLAGQRWGVSAQGILWRERGGRTLMHNLKLLIAAVADMPDAPLFPQPIGYLSGLSLLVHELPAGVRLSAKLETEDRLEAAVSALGVALSRLHQQRIETKHSRSPADELESLAKKVQALGLMENRVSERCEKIIRTLTDLARMAPERWAPVLRRIHPEEILFADDRIRFSQIEKLTWSHPYLDIADFVTRLSLAGFRQQKVAKFDKLREHFLASYFGDEHPDDTFPLFEAAALVRLACSRAERPEDQAPLQLLQLAEFKLAPIR